MRETIREARACQALTDGAIKGATLALERIYLNFVTDRMEKIWLVWILRGIWGSLGDCTKLSSRCLRKWPNTQEGKDQGGTSMGRWQGRRLEGSDMPASVWVGWSPGWALALILQKVVWPVFLLNHILNYLFCVPAPGKDSRAEPGLVEGARIEDTGQDFQGVHERGVPVKAENMEEYRGERRATKATSSKDSLSQHCEM